MDEHSGTQTEETWYDRDREISVRTLGDGSRQRIIKTYADVPFVSQQLRAVGLEPTNPTIDGDWLLASAVRPPK